MLTNFVSNEHNLDKKPVKRHFYPGIDIIRYLAALAVIAIHIGTEIPEVTYADALGHVLSVAVPFFFMANGFMLTARLQKYSRTKDRRRLLLKRSKLLFGCVGLWLIVSLPLAIYHYSDETVWTSVLHYARTILFESDSVYAWPMWYILTLAVVTGLYGLTIRMRGHYVVLLTIFTAAYLLSCVVNPDFGETINRAIHNGQLATSHTIAGGMYVFAGGLMYYLITDKRLLAWLIIPLAIASGALFVFGLPFGQLTAGIAFLAVGMLIPSSTRNFWFDIHNQCAWLFYSHIYILMPIVILAPMFTADYPYFTAASIFVLSALLAVVLNLIQKVPGMQKLEYLIR